MNEVDINIDRFRKLKLFQNTKNNLIEICYKLGLDLNLFQFKFCKDHSHKGKPKLQLSTGSIC